jgi:hypothetical protein
VRAMALLVLLGQSLTSYAPVPVPKAVSESLRGCGYHVPRSVQANELVQQDLDANGYEDWAILVNPGSRQAAILLSIQFEDHWRGGNIDIWHGTPGPVKIEVLPPGKYGRQAECAGPLQPNERQQIESRVPGVLVTFAGGSQRAYQLGPHAWHYVCLGNAS